MNNQTLRNIIGEGIGEASVCWVERDGSASPPVGIFDSSRASAIVDRIMAAVEEQQRTTNMNDTTLRERINRINLSPFLHYARGWTMRVWREEAKNKEFDPNHTLPDTDILERLNSAAQRPMSQYDLALFVLELERVNAVEVVDTVGAGEVLYKDWP